VVKLQAWVRKTSGNGVDENFYSASVHSLLEAKSFEEFQSVLTDVSDRWSQDAMLERVLAMDPASVCPPVCHKSGVL